MITLHVCVYMNGHTIIGILNVSCTQRPCACMKISHFVHGDTMCMYECVANFTRVDIFLYNASRLYVHAHIVILCLRSSDL